MVNDIVGVGVLVNVDVLVAVAVGVGVDEAVGVGVDVFVEVGVRVGVAVDGAVPVGVNVLVAVEVGVLVGVTDVAAVDVGVLVFGLVETAVGVLVAADFDVGVEVAGTNTSVLVGVIVGTFVLVAGTCVGIGVMVAVAVSRIRVGITAPGVRKTSIQTGWVWIAGSIGGTNSMGWFGGKSPFGLRLEPISAFRRQRGEKRSAQFPAMITHNRPRRMMIATIIQSRRSCSISFMSRSLGR